MISNLNRFFAAASGVALFVALFGGEALAQRAGGQPPPRFTVFMAEGTPPTNVIMPGPQNARVPITLNASTKSPAYDLPSSGAVALYQNPENQQERPRLLLRAQVPSGMRHALLLVAPNPEAGPDIPLYRAVVVDDSPQALPANGVRFLNYAGLPLAVEFKGEAMDLAPGPSRPMRVVAQGETSGTARVRIAVDRGAGLEVAYNAELTMGANERVSILIMPPAEGARRLNVRLIRERVAPVQAPGESRQRPPPGH